MPNNSSGNATGDIKASNLTILSGNSVASANVARIIITIPSRRHYYPK